MLIDGVFIGFYIVPVVVFVTAVIVAWRRLEKGRGFPSAILGFMLTLVLGAMVCVGLLVLYAGLYYAGGGH